MKKQQAIDICQFVLDNFDMVHDQEAWFDFCEKLLGVVIEDANKGKYAKDIVGKFPMFFEQA